jgi:hypothetical protein
MYADNSISKTNSTDSTGLKVIVSFKTGAITSNPSLLNPTQTIVRDLKISDNLKGGIRPCTAIIFSKED